jgi:hypothetical protein
MMDVCAETTRPGAGRGPRAQTMPPTATDQQLAAEIKELRGDFHRFGIEITEKLGEINIKLGEFRGRTETSLAVAKWVAGAAVSIGVLLVGWGVTQAIRTSRIEDSIVQLRDTVQKQDAQVSELIKLQKEMHIEFFNPGQEKPKRQ